MPFLPMLPLLLYSFVRRHGRLLREQGEVREKRNQEERARNEQMLRERATKETEEAERKALQDELKRNAVADYQ